MKRIGVFVDVSNIYYCVGKKYEYRKLDYRKYLDFIRDFGELTKVIAYGSQMSNEASGFIHCLEKIGFQTKFKAVKTYTQNQELRRKADWDVGITMDIVNMIDRFDMILLGTADGDLSPVVDWAIRRGVDVVILACGISRDLKELATEFIEIPESLLEEQSEAA
ncbi:hypothetical protein LCGC14_0811510 [marine sediment metagenome]|uniref:NYN domain-containing protein n=1 Tax=marine sediment metagenome TaxID=412755 RepID=A0A0F9PR16_9ZZZZ